ncbi:hypothetical protein J2T55_000089 [Methylohalomonas lacus]|uniref:Uncharacterized protein n=1 Tax=Methylohalomonas lacus TaxID=398773 RepID=A0AAE3L4Q4_9GAMM|nr:hypothetical protein [Methylohalomonas lacus]
MTGWPCRPSLVDKRDTRYEIRDTRYEIRDTRYEIRDTRYEIRDTIFTPALVAGLAFKR